MINSRDLDELSPTAHMYAMRLLHACAAAGIPLLVTCTYRDDEYQAHLYAQGRTRPGKKVTNANAGQSAHNHRAALDFVPLTNGKPDWNDLEKFKKIGAIAKSVGFAWGGDFKSFPDMPHLEVPNWKSTIVAKK